MANNEDTLLREVEEELRRERMESLWKQYGTYFIVAAIAVIVAVGAYKFYQNRQISARYAAGAAFDKAVGLVEAGKAAEARSAFEDLAKSGQSGYAALAKLRVAALDVAAGSKDKALASFEALSVSSDVDPLLKSFAKLQAAALKIGDADFTEVQNRLNDLAGDSSPWRASARELIGLAALKAGKTDIARTTLEQLLADRTAPSDVRERAQVMMAAIIEGDLAKAGAAKNEVGPKSEGAGTPKPAEAAAGDKKPAATEQK